MKRTTYNNSWLDTKNNYDTTFDLPNQWKDLFKVLHLSDIQDNLHKELIIYGDRIPIYPPKNLVWNAFHLTPPDKLRVVILGQDPYINLDQAMGLAFSVPSELPLPPSLKNIYKKLNIKHSNGDLSHWSKQGVLLLNTTLTVRAKQSNSHSKYWRNITDAIISYISKHFENIVFMLWGTHAYKKKDLIDSNKHYILISSHPSPLGYTKKMQGYCSFSESNHFEQCNTLIKGDPIQF